MYFHRQRGKYIVWALTAGIQRNRKKSPSNPMPGRLEPEGPDGRAIWLVHEEYDIDEFF